MGVDTYGFDRQFEHALGLLCATRPKFFGSVGRALDLELLSTDEVKLVLKACRLIDKELGHGPTSVVTVLQRVRRWMDEGLVTRAQHDAVGAMLLDADEDDLPTEDEMRAEVVPVLQHRMRRHAITTALEDMSKRGDLAEAARLIAKSQSIGKIDQSTGTRFGMNLFDDIAKARALDRLPTGILELDAALRGGLPRGKQLVFVGGTGAGKSMALAHMVGQAMRLGAFSAVATLEIAEAEWHARVMANLTSVPTEDILANDTEARALAAAALQRMQPTLGSLVVKDFPAKITTMIDIEQWVAQCEEEEGRPVDFVAIDYGDKLTVPNRGQRSEYDVAGEAFERMRLFGKNKSKWIATASQAIRRAGKDKGRVVDVDDAADSQHKARVADIVITLSPRENDELIYHVAKNRGGNAGAKVGPFPHNWAYGQMVHLP